MFDFLKDFGEVKTAKIFTSVTGANKKRACVSKRMVLLEDFSQGYSENIKEFSKEEMKRRHLGKFKCTAKFKTAEELKQILTKYFAPISA